MRHLDDKKEYKKFTDILIKLSHIFNDIYITKNNYVISLDIHKPFIIRLYDDDLQLLYKAFGEFNLLHIDDLKKFKKEHDEIYKYEKEKNNPPKKIKEEESDEPIVQKDVMIDETPIEEKLLNFKNHHKIVTSRTEISKVGKRLDKYLSYINADIIFKSFITEETSEKITSSLFTKREHIDFLSDINNRIIISKTLLPLITEKNLNILKYNDREISDGLGLIILYFEFPKTFEVYSLNFYIKLD